MESTNHTIHLLCIICFCLNGQISNLWWNSIDTWKKKPYKRRRWRFNCIWFDLLLFVYPNAIGENLINLLYQHLGISRIPYFWCWMIWNSSGLLYNVQTMPRFWIKSTVSIIMRRDRMCRDEKQTDAPPTLWSSLMMDRSLKQKKTTTSHLFLRLLSWKIVDAAMTTHKEKIQNICRYIFYTRQETIDATNFFTRKKVFFFFFLILSIIWCQSLWEELGKLFRRDDDSEIPPQFFIYLFWQDTVANFFLLDCGCCINQIGRIE